MLQSGMPLLKLIYTTNCNIMKKIFIVACMCSLAFISAPQNRFADSLRKLIENSTNPIEKFDLLNKLGEGLFSGGNVKVDSAFCFRLLRIAQDLKNDSLLAISYNWIGNYFSWTSHFNKALEFFLKGVPLAEKVNDKRRLSSLYIDISFIHNYTGNAAEEFKYINLARKNLPDKSSPAYAFMNIQVKSLLAKYYLFNGKLDSALHYTQAIREINLDLKSYFFDAVSNVLTAGVYEKLGDTALAEIFYKKGVVIEDSRNDLFPGASPKKMYTEYLLRHNKPVLAKSIALQSLSTSKKIKNNELGLVAAGHLQHIYYRLGNIDSAYYYSRLELTLRDSVFSEEKVNRIQSLAFVEQLRMRDEELKVIKAEEQRSRQIQYLFISIGLIASIIVFLLLSHSIIVNEYVIKYIGIIGLLVVFEFINLLIHPALERITQHSPAIMLLILVCIAALLVPLHHKLQKWVTHKMVEKNKRIRLAAARRTIERLEGNIS